MKTIKNYAENVLKYNYNRSISLLGDRYPENKPYTIAEWCELESQSDSNFYRWLFDDPNIDDFGSNLTDEEKQSARDFFESLL